MTLVLTRKWAEADATIGELVIDGMTECLTLEDEARPEKIAGKTAIPAGRYRVVLTPSGRVKAGGLWSPRADCALPLLENVPNFTGIRIHAGNSAKDTEGCILVGKVRGTIPGRIFASRAALVSVIEKIAMGLKRGEVWITVENIPA